MGEGPGRLGPFCNLEVLELHRCSVLQWYRCYTCYCYCVAGSRGLGAVVDEGQSHDSSVPVFELQLQFMSDLSFLVISVALLLLCSQDNVELGVLGLLRSHRVHNGNEVSILWQVLAS